MSGFWIYQGSEYAGVTQGSEYAWIFSRHAFYIIELGTKIIPKNVILLPQKALWTILKLSRKVENYYAIVKENSSGRFFSSLRSLSFAVQPFYVNSRPAVRSYQWNTLLGNNNDWNLADFNQRGVYDRLCVTFVNQIETNPHTIIVP